MNDQHDIIDLGTLIADLHRAVRYAARVGVLKDRAMIRTLENAEHAIAAGRPPDAFAVTSALNEISALIAPMTIADLCFERDPFLPKNQRRSTSLRMLLMFFALFVLAAIGDCMYSLQREQEAWTSLEKIRSLEPQEKLSELRRFAQWDEPLALPRTPRSLNDQYHQKVAELMLINSTMVNTVSRAILAEAQPMIPFQRLLSPQAADSAPSAAELAQIPPAATDVKPGSELCAQDAKGEMRLPTEAKDYPEWMKTALRDSLSDMCFQLNVVAPGGGGQIPSEAISQLAIAGSIKDKISLRSIWLLPFMFGLLGSVLFVMRDVDSVRTPSVGLLAIAMRILLGDVAGIVVDWFVSADSALLPTASLISLPFALAFLTGYGIDILFNTLDKLHRSVLVSTTSRPR